DGTLTVTVPADLALGTYTLKVFSEQYNGDKKTDYASAFCDVTLTTPTQLDIDKAAAKAELDTYKDPADYRADEQATLAAAISAGKDAIDAATDSAAVATALTNAKRVIDAIKTDAQLTEEEQAAAQDTPSPASGSGVCPLCHKRHGNSATQFLIARIHRLIWIIKCLTIGPLYLP
ncbi:MAG: hypothetical protein IJK98_03475, partial [Clostridia bacterium]|nr:hypothetical protein [Clostridia bacterium]